MSPSWMIPFHNLRFVASAAQDPQNWNEQRCPSKQLQQLPLHSEEGDDDLPDHCPVPVLFE